MIEQLIQRVFDYAYDVVEKKRKAGKKQIQACKRFLNDIEKMQGEGYPFHFDAEELLNFYEWSRMFKHRKGILAGQPIELNDFQLFLAANIFCWKREDGSRRFRKAYIQLARKNAKTQFLAIITSYAAFLSDETEECYIAGWSREQSSICYEEVLGQIGTCELLQGKYSDSYGKIRHLRSGSIIQPLSREARKTGDGKNPSIAVIDEYHAHETSEIYDVMISGMVARKNRLIAIITTAGFDMSVPCFTEYEYCSRIIDPSDDVENDEYFVMICELDPEDDIKDGSNWIKANPIVATYESGLDSLRSELAIALEVPEKMRSFLTKNMNKWVDMKDDGYMPLNRWDECEVDSIPDLKKFPCFPGLDLSATTDLTSIGMVFKLDGGKYFVRQHSFMPEDKFKERMQTDKVRYDLWAEQGYLTLTPGSVVDYNFVESYLIEMREDGYQIDEVPYDKWNATHIANNLINEGFEAVEMPQSIRHLSEPTKSFRTEVFQKNVLHEKDPLLRWAMGNAITKMDDQENIMISKSKSKNRIDPVAAIINGFARASVKQPKRESIYKTRGAMVL